ncbi:MAG TPA: wax ester/triacylglycerol synthase domain-containing protein, partial [Solirubrobacteraceae bacterium]|nr:wax ester/triacylglycerol synthase domain-containing protein [Solirubrobacteraceae bacterium]
MSQQHLDRLTAIDAGFLHNEGSASHMHVGAVVMLEGPPPAFEDLLDSIRSRLHLVPRYRQKLAGAPARSGRPLWVDDPSFDVEYHVRQSALPRPGSEQQLLRTAGRIFSQRLDRSKPLWELWVVEGLEDERFALISKTHHALVDGVGGVDLAQVLFDLGPVPQDIEHPDEPWEPAPEPHAAELMGAGATDAVRSGLTMTAGALGAMADPRRAARQARP